jgi:DNA topoisomerase-1
MKNKQLATAMYLIDVLAIRAGNEKGEDEADTVGCCSLRLEHIELITPNTLKFDFLGKDSIRYINEVEVSSQVFKNMKELRKGKKKSDMIFDLLNTSYLNNHLKKLMPGLTAKVFRTYNASHTFQEQLKNTNPNDSEVLKLQSFNRANRQVAILCNHQKTVSKNFETQMEKQEDRIRAIKLDIKRVKGSILASDKKLVKSYPELEEPESDLEDDWCREFIKNKYEDAREKAKVKFEVKNEQLESSNEETVPQSKLQSQLDSYDEKESQMLSEVDTGKYEKVSDPEKLIARWQKLNESLLKQKTVKTEKVIVI